MNDKFLKELEFCISVYERIIEEWDIDFITSDYIRGRVECREACLADLKDLYTTYINEKK